MLRSEVWERRRALPRTDTLSLFILDPLGLFLSYLSPLWVEHMSAHIDRSRPLRKKRKKENGAWARSRMAVSFGWCRYFWRIPPAPQRFQPFIQVSSETSLSCDSPFSTHTLSFATAELKCCDLCVNPTPPHYSPSGLAHAHWWWLWWCQSKKLKAASAGQRGGGRGGWRSMRWRRKSTIRRKRREDECICTWKAQVTTRYKVDKRVHTHIQSLPPPRQ